MPNDIANNMADTIHQFEKELKDLREENKVLISECDRLIKEKGELLSKVSGGDVLRICQLEEQLEKAKELLKAAMEDMKILYEAGKDEGCLGIDYKWRYADAMDFIDAIPATDVQLVKHGRWIWDSNAPYREHGAYKCSNCDGHSDFEENYCPNCGARMDGGSYKNDI